MAGSKSPICVVVQVPEGDQPVAARVVEHVLGPAALVLGRGDHGLDQLEAHRLGVEGVGRLDVPGGEREVVVAHRSPLGSGRRPDLSGCAYRTRRRPVRDGSTGGPARGRRVRPGAAATGSATVGPCADPPARARRRRGGSPSGSLVAGGLVIAGVARRPHWHPSRQPEASAEFIAAFQRSLEGTYAVRGRVHPGARRRADARARRRSWPSARPIASGASSAASPARSPATRSCARRPRAARSTAGRRPPPPIPPRHSVSQMRACGPTSPRRRSTGRWRSTSTSCFELTQVRASRACCPTAPRPGSASTRRRARCACLEQHLEGAVDTFEADRDPGSTSATDDFSLDQERAYDSRRTARRHR